ncbi:MAG: TlpA family protein disulfide reductase [Planctomycetota bacterium]
MKPLFKILRFAVLLLPSCVLRAPVDGLEVGDQAPDLEINDWFSAAAPTPEADPESSTPQPSALGLRDFRGQPVLLEFWSSECPPCVASIPKMKEITLRHQGSLQVVSVHVDLDRTKPVGADTLRAFLKENEINYPVAHDVDGLQWERFDFNYLPHAVLLDEEGRVDWSGNLVFYDLGKRVERLSLPAAEAPAINGSCENGVCSLK